MTEGIYPDGPHGTRSHYVHGPCSCQACRDANAAYYRAATSRKLRIRASQRLEGIFQDTTIPHGVASSYEWHGCRCDDCVEAVKKEWRRRKQNRKLTG